VDELNHQFRNQIRAKGYRDLAVIKMIFNDFDFNKNGKLELEEFEQALGHFGLFPKMVDLKALHKFYDVDGDGTISYNEFIKALADK